MPCRAGSPVQEMETNATINWAWLDSLISGQFVKQFFLQELTQKPPSTNQPGPVHLGIPCHVVSIYCTAWEVVSLTPGSSVLPTQYCFLDSSMGCFLQYSSGPSSWPFQVGWLQSCEEPSSSPFQVGWLQSFEGPSSSSFHVG